MQKIAAVLLICLSMVGQVSAQAGTQPEITEVIRKQIDAFLKDDFDGAFSYASPNIRGLFGTSANFGRMVKQGYPMVWRPADVTFGEAKTAGPNVFQRVVIRDVEGAVHVLEYEMIPAADTWKINGVRLVRAPQLGA